MPQSFTLKFNESTLVPLDTIRFIRPLDDEERARLTKTYPDADMSQFNTSITFTGHSQKLARETIDQFRDQGLAFANLGSGRFVPAANILSAEPFTKSEATAMDDKGYALKSTYRSRVVTTAGLMLSSAHPSQVMDRRAKALGLTGQGAPAPKPAGA